MVNCAKYWAPDLDGRLIEIIQVPRTISEPLKGVDCFSGPLVE
jgi:hypothetical protein